MTSYDRIWDVAEDNHGVITTAAAKRAGVSAAALVSMAQTGKLIHIGHGVYKLAKHARGELDEYAEAVALVGETGFIRGASSLMMRGLVPYDPATMRLGVSRRVRRKLPRTFDIRCEPSPDVELIEGIPAEKVGKALEDARKTGALDVDRLDEVEAAL